MHGLFSCFSNLKMGGTKKKRLAFTYSCINMLHLITFPTAFKFCLQYTRKAEFRKLCDNLRMHLGQIQRHHNQSTAINLNNPESQSMHLETRLVQLDSAISMELWQV